MSSEASKTAPCCRCRCQQPPSSRRPNAAETENDSRGCSSDVIEQGHVLTSGADLQSRDHVDSDMKIVHFCQLVHRLKHLPRAGWLRHQGLQQPESVASHMYRMALLAMCLDGEQRQPAVDRMKCIRMALVHDLAESIVGDITPHCGVSAEEKLRRETEGMKHIASLLPDAAGREMIDLWHDYESQVSNEARLVKQLDRFDLMAQAFEYEQQLQQPGELQEFFDNSNAKQVVLEEPVLGWTRQLMDERQHFLKTARQGNPADEDGSSS